MILMEENQTILVKVTAIRENVKTFKKGNTPYYRHDIEVVDQKGNTDRKEYLTTTPTQSAFFLQHPQPWQRIRCVHVDTKGDEIEPIDAQQAMQVARDAVNGTPQPNNFTPNMRPDAVTGEAINCHNINVHGKSIMFCTAWAKDLLIAELGQRKKGSQITEDDMENLVKRADFLNNAICDRLSF